MQHFYNSLTATQPAGHTHFAMLARLTQLNLARLDRLAEQFIWNEWN